METSPKRYQKVLKISFVVLLLLFYLSMIIVFFVKFSEILAIFSAFTDWILQRPFGGMVLIIVCFIFGVVFMIPTTFFMFTIGVLCHSLMGMFLGFCIGLLIVYICTVIGSVLAFLFSRSMLKDYLLSILKPSMLKTRAILRALETNGFKIMFLLRLAPIFPFSVLNYALGASDVNLFDYCLATIGILPKQALYMYLAVSVGSLSEAIQQEKSNSTQLIVIVSVGGILGIIAAVYVTIIARREMNKIIQDNQEPILGEIVNEDNFK